jgi:hypothetical protein
MSVDIIKIWHEKARPNPVNKDFQVQLGCHLEEIGEMLDQLSGDDDFAHALIVKATVAVYKIAEALKSGSAAVHVLDRCQFLDSLADQIVTSVGVGHCARMNITEAVRRVNDSNYTKLVDGMFIRDDNGKIVKPANYKPPQLEDLI